jgi:signal transduction histidine kinase
MDVEQLRSLFLFGGLDDGQLGQILAAGEEIPFEEGTVLFREGDPADYFWVLLSGRVDLVRRAGRRDPVVMLTMERPGLWAGGFQAWNPSSSYLATGRGASAGTMLHLPSAALGELVRSWFPFGVHLIEGFFQTVRSMDTLSRQRESLIALGTMAAGLAHELNNPASATARAVEALQETADALLSSLVRLAERSLLADQFIALESLRRQLGPATAGEDSLVVADREEAVADWLADHDVDEGWQIAPTLAAAGADVDWCERAAAVLDGTTLGPGLEWVAGTLNTRVLLAEMKESTGRISGLIGSVRSYSQVDRATVQLVDLTEGIESTLVMLKHKMSAGVTVVREYATDAPRIETYPGDLNQVWTNLIDNALDAMDGDGVLSIATRVDGDAMVVEVGDTGPGMAPEVQARAFEPFFTTKEVGKGTGLGLDVCRSIVVDRHHGQITIDSAPGRTVVGIRLPLRQP